MDEKPNIDKMMTIAIENAEGAIYKVRGRSRYLRKALTYVNGKSPEEFKAFEPRNGYEEAMANLRAMSCKRNGSAVSAIKTQAEILGEKFDPKEKPEKDEANVKPTSAFRLDQASLN